MKYETGSRFPLLSLETIQGKPIKVPTWQYDFIHFQFRRYAGCPVCNIHLREMANRQGELEARKVGVVAVFASSKEDMQPLLSELPFMLVADPERKLYEEFGVNKSAAGLFHPKVVSRMFQSLANGHPISAMEMNTQMPADFLLTADGKIVQAKYGKHAADHWTTDEILELVAKNKPVAEKTAKIA